MIRASMVAALGAAALLAPAGGLVAQGSPLSDPVLQRIWDEGHQRSQLVPLAQALLDSIGPRLTGTPGQESAHEWAVAKYQEWGIAARNVQYGTWRGWDRGTTHVDLLEPRVRSLEATMLAWSPPTRGPVTGEVVGLPSSGFAEWLGTIRGKYVLFSFPQPSCRAPESWREHGTSAALQRLQQQWESEQEEWTRRVQGSGMSRMNLLNALERAGAVGILTSNWSGGWGVNQIFEAYTQTIPMLDVSCEDYGLLARLAENRQGPVLRVNADSRFTGERPVFNTIAEIRGSERPDEYVILSAHFDSWDGASGATDNGTGTITMMEAMRILRVAYPQPKRTILVGHWSGEEQGLNGSRAFVEDHPEIVSGIQVVLNQDNGTGRVVYISMQGFAELGGFFERWLAQIPTEITQQIQLDAPAFPGGGGSDYASFVCARAPAVGLSSLGWDYSTYTWHTNRDTFDKIVWDDVRNNAVLTAMLTYLASEDSNKVPRGQARELTNQRGQSVRWPTCAPAMRSSPR
jgi:carboxypeptidase Q